ncbi:MAG: hypothetical protein HOJ74_01560, partial [Gemmatimonadales bacterium]|nr:hypothetical protein [Gemmatimonadales bacterium]MBT6373390.1 hypothetical protein [Gemmatimonadales bacterium]
MMRLIATFGTACCALFVRPAFLAAQGGGAPAAEHVTPEVPMGITVLFAGILVAMIVSLALEEKLHAKKSLIVGLFAV